MFSAKVFDGRSIKDLWHDIYFISINGISARLVHFIKDI